MRHHVTRLLPYRPEQLFELVGDVRSYPDFVPWISSMTVAPAPSPSSCRSVFDAEAGVAFAFLKERFRTRVVRDAAAREIFVNLVSGPFRHLDNRWSFLDHPSGCRVIFDIDFMFKSRVLELLLRANLALAVNRLIGCFEARAECLYGVALAPSASSALIPASSGADRAPS